MENAKGSIPTDDKSTAENPNPNAPSSVDAAGSAAVGPSLRPPSRTPFTSLSQLDADLALARTLQEQERAYMMLRMNGGGEDRSEYESSEESFLDGNGYGDDGDFLEQRFEEEVDVEEEEEVDAEEEEEEEEGEEGNGLGSDYDEEEDAFDVNEDREIDPADFEDDEAYARALQDAEEREVAVRLMALTGLNDWGVEDLGHHGSNSQEAWQDVDPDELSYEELIALGEVVGTESRGLSADTIASLSQVNYNAQNTQDGDSDPCVICRLDYENGDSLVVLSCKHSYHSECINQWLQINKSREAENHVTTRPKNEIIEGEQEVCPVCSAEVSTSGSTGD